MFIQGLQHIKEKLKHTVKKDCRENTSLKQTYIKKKETSRPLLGLDFRLQFFIVIEDQFLYKIWNMVPVQIKLNEVMPNTDICIS